MVKHNNRSNVPIMSLASGAKVYLWYVVEQQCLMYNEQKETSEYVCKKSVVANVAYNTIEQVNDVSMQNITARAKDDQKKD